jgi:hypothetical protein
MLQAAIENSPPLAAPTAFYYTNNATNNTYILNQTMTDFSTADKWCNDKGGHLAAWRSLPEQQDAERYYVGKGWLLPTYHKGYWMGLTSSTSRWPRYNWTEPGLKPPTGATYVHWGRYEVRGRSAGKHSSLWALATSSLLEWSVGAGR